MLIEIQNNNITLIAEVNDQFEITECKSSHGIDFLPILLDVEKQMILDKAKCQ